MRSTEVQRKLTCSSSSLAMVPMAASSPTVAAVDQQLCVEGGRYGDLRVTAGSGHRAGLAGPAPINKNQAARRERTQTKPGSTTVSSPRTGVGLRSLAKCCSRTARPWHP